MIMHTFTHFLQQYEPSSNLPSKVLSDSLIPLIPKVQPWNALYRYKHLCFLIAVNQLGHLQPSSFAQSLVVCSADNQTDILAKS